MKVGIHGLEIGLEGLDIRRQRLDVGPQSRGPTGGLDPLAEESLASVARNLIF